MARSSQYSYMSKFSKLLLLAVGTVTLGQPLTGIDQLHNVDELLESHDGC